MATDFGTGIACVTSVGPRFVYVSGLTNLGMSLARRLITPRGILDYAPDYGTDMRDYLNGANTPATRFAAARAAQDEVTKDERVLTATATVTFADSAMSIDITCITADGPFTLVLSVNALTTALLSINSVPVAA
jgi:phage baseplate assembly protein W